MTTNGVSETAFHIQEQKPLHELGKSLENSPHSIRPLSGGMYPQMGSLTTRDPDWDPLLSFLGLHKVSTCSDTRQPYPTVISSISHIFWITIGALSSMDSPLMPYLVMTQANTFFVRVIFNHWAYFVTSLTSRYFFFDPVVSITFFLLSHFSLRLRSMLCCCHSIASPWERTIGYDKFVLAIKWRGDHRWARNLSPEEPATLNESENVYGERA